MTKIIDLKTFALTQQRVHDEVQHASPHQRGPGPCYGHFPVLAPSCFDRSDPIRVVEVETNATVEARARRSGRFLKGPISLPPLAAAACLPGKALALFLVVHHQITLTRKSVVTLPAGVLADFGVDKDAKARGLRALERAGLVRVARRRGCAIRVELTGSLPEPA